MNVQFKGAESTGLWGVVYLAQLFFFAYGKYVIEHIAVNIHRAIFHPSGSPREFLWHHPFPIAIAIGFGLGMLPLRVLAAVMGALSTGTTERWRKLWQRTKPWIAIPFIMLFVISIISYDKGEVNAPSTWQSFFAASCSFDALHLVYRNDCVNQLLFTAPLVCALAYSATSLLEYTRNSSDRESLTGTSGNISEIV